MSNPVCFLHNPPTFPRFPAPPQARPRRKPPLSSSSLFPPLPLSPSPYLPLPAAPPLRPRVPRPPSVTCPSHPHRPDSSTPPTTPTTASRSVDHPDENTRKPAHLRPDPSTTTTTPTANWPISVPTHRPPRQPYPQTSLHFHPAPPYPCENGGRASAQPPSIRSRRTDSSDSVANRHHTLRRASPRPIP